jgi:hypothetical protein
VRFNTPDPLFFGSEAALNIAFEPSLFRAMATCLSPCDKCRMLRQDMQQGYMNRRVILSLISEDMQAEFLPDHGALIDGLIDSMKGLSGNQAQSCGYCLEHLTASAPDEFTDRIIDAMITSRFKSVRDRAGRLIQKRWDSKYLTLLRELVPDRLGEATQTVYVDNEEVELLYATRLALRDHLTDRNVTRLYRRLAQSHPASLRELRASAPVSFLYIAAKEGVLVEPKLAFRIAREAHGTDKFGLVVWSIGRMKMWDVLTRICEQLIKWDRERTANLMLRYGIHDDGVGQK